MTATQAFTQEQSATNNVDFDSQFPPVINEQTLYETETWTKWANLARSGAEGARKALSIARSIETDDYLMDLPIVRRCVGNLHAVANDAMQIKQH